MSHLYANEQLWTHVCMVGFAEHYVLNHGTGTEDIAKPFDTFQRQKRSRPPEAPIFGGVVLQSWQDDADGVVEHKVGAFKEAGVDYIRFQSMGR